MDGGAFADGGGQVRLPVITAVIDAGVETVAVGDQGAFFRSTGDADSPASQVPGNLSGDPADGAGRRIDGQNIAGLRLGQLGHARPGGQAGHAEDAEMQGRRDVGRDLAGAIGANPGPVGPAGLDDDVVTGGKVRIAAFLDLRDAEAGQAFTGGGGGLAHMPTPDAGTHVGVDRQV